MYKYEEISFLNSEEIFLSFLLSECSVGVPREFLGRSLEVLVIISLGALGVECLESCF